MVFYICSYRLNGVGGSVPERVSCRPGHGTQGFGTSGQPNGEREDIRRVIGRPLPSSLTKKNGSRLRHLWSHKINKLCDF